MNAAPPVFAVHAACIRGVEAFAVTVEVSMTSGIPGMAIVGLADGTVLEARSRIRCALRSAGYEVPRKSITINLSPGDIRKNGSGLDLPMAVAVLAASGQIPVQGLDQSLFVGEVALTGAVLPVRGSVPYQILARESGLNLVCAMDSTSVVMPGTSCSFLDSIARLKMGVDQAARRIDPSRESLEQQAVAYDFSDVVGQEIAKRAMVIAAAGEHGLLMVGSPGSGKSMLAKRMCGILPSIDRKELQEALCIHSVMGEPLDALLRGERPFRNPHHSISAAGLIGGGRPVHPGETSLAHGGVLYLEEMGEWPSNILQMLRQPIEENNVRIVRADGAYVFPSRFQLLAASNPCPCGYLGDPGIECKCSPAAIERYQAKLGGPLADRIDLSVDIRRPDPKLVVDGADGLSTEAMRRAVESARAFKAERLSRAGHLEDRIEESLQNMHFTLKGKEALLGFSRINCLTARGVVRLSRIARTVADLELEECIDEPHVLEAAMFQGREINDGS